MHFSHFKAKTSVNYVSYSFFKILLKNIIGPRLSSCSYNNINSRFSMHHVLIMLNLLYYISVVEWFCKAWS